MTTAAYTAWVADGEPVKLAVPVVQYHNAVVSAGWPAAQVGTLGDPDHLTADPPQDHCPFSATGWPGTNPYPYVMAIDVPHRPEIGKGVYALVAYWLSEARAGHTPWVKYIIWQAQRYDVRNGWSPVASSGHYDHVHVSMRSDYFLSTVGNWPIIGGSDMALDPATKAAYDQVWGAEVAMRDGTATHTAGGLASKPHWLVEEVKALRAKLDLIATPAPVDVPALAAALALLLAEQVETILAPLVHPLTAEQIAQAAFEGAQRAEGE